MLLSRNQKTVVNRVRGGRNSLRSSIAVWASKKSSRLIVVSLIAALWGLIGATDAFAAHFRYAHLSWQPAASPANTINFTLQTAWARTYFAGACYNTATFANQPCTGPTGLPGVGDAVFEPNTALNPGRARSSPRAAGSCTGCVDRRDQQLAVRGRARPEQPARPRQPTR